MSLKHVPIDWPYAPLSDRKHHPAPANLDIVLTSPVRRDDYAVLVRAVAAGLQRSALRSFTTPDAASIDVTISSFRGDTLGAVLALASATSAPTVRARLERGQHLRAGSVASVLAQWPEATRREVGGAMAAVIARAENLASDFKRMLDALSGQRLLDSAAYNRLSNEHRAIARLVQERAADVAALQLVGGAGSASATVSEADRAKMAESLQEGFRYAALLHERGLTDPATHVARTLHTLAPEAVPADIPPSDYRRLSFGVKVRPATARGPLLDAVATLRGSSTAGDNFGHSLRSGGLQPRPSSAQSEPWQFSVGIEHHNDNMASIRDGRLRSDDGPTTTNSVELAWRRDSERWLLNIDQALFTERGGMLRTDLFEMTVRHLQTEKTGRVFFDTVTSGWLFGLQGIGDYGGAHVQDGWHGATGWLIGGRRLGAGLQDTYSSERNMALLLGAQVQLDKRVGLFEFGVGGHAEVPVGPVGYGRAAADLNLRVGESSGPYASIGSEGGVQWTTGSAMEFDGAPRDGFFLTPRVGIGWEFGTWSLGLEWQGNRFNTQPGLGNANGESVALSVRFGR